MLDTIRLKLGTPELMAQLAEEAAELAQAALKLRRAMDGKNPTPKDKLDCWRNLIEEYTDVVLCAQTLDLMADDGQIRRKTARWAKRLSIGQGSDGDG